MNEDRRHARPPPNTAAVGIAIGRATVTRDGADADRERRPYRPRLRAGRSTSEASWRCATSPARGRRRWFSARSAVASPGGPSRAVAQPWQQRRKGRRYSAPFQAYAPARASRAS